MEYFQIVALVLIIILVIFVIAGSSKKDSSTNTEAKSTDILKEDPLIYFLWGSYFGKDIVPVERIVQVNGENVYMAFHDKYTKMVSQSGIGKYYEGPVSTFDATKWNTYLTVPSKAYNFRVCSSQCIKGCTDKAQNECL
jgi:hypothetical protein